MLRVLEDQDALAEAGAGEIAARIAGVEGTCALAVSGGRSPWRMLRLLSQRDLDWSSVHVFQVDERVAPEGDPARNLTGLLESFTAPATIHPMPVTDSDLIAAAGRYARELREACGGTLDVVHLGLGADGHTASLVPGDPALRVRDADVALTGTYRGYRRMTLTFPALERARQIVWLISGDDKQDALKRMLEGDPSVPASRLKDGLVLADRAAAGGLGVSANDG